MSGKKNLRNPVNAFRAGWSAAILDYPGGPRCVSATTMNTHSASTRSAGRRPGRGVRLARLGPRRARPDPRLRAPRRRARGQGQERRRGRRRRPGRDGWLNTRARPGQVNSGWLGSAVSGTGPAVGARSLSRFSAMPRPPSRRATIIVADGQSCGSAYSSRRRWCSSCAVSASTHPVPSRRLARKYPSQVIS